MVRFAMRGGTDLARALSALPAALSKRVVLDGLTEAAEPIRARMADRAPRAPGAPDIADHIAISPAKGEFGEPAVAIGPERGFFYGKFLEFGTVKMHARPFMRPAFDELASTTTGRIGGSLWTAIKRAADRGAVNTGGGTL